MSDNNQSLKRSTSRARARNPEASTETTTSAPAGPPTETIEIAVGPNITGHDDQIARVHQLEDADDASGSGATDREG